jgi:hypothetical protein
MTQAARHVSDYGYGLRVVHTLVQWTDAEGRKCSAYVNPTLYDKHGMAALAHPDWFKGEPASNK